MKWCQTLCMTKSCNFCSLSAWSIYMQVFYGFLRTFVQTTRPFFYTLFAIDRYESFFFITNKNVVKWKYWNSLCIDFYGATLHKNWCSLQIYEKLIVRVKHLFTQHLVKYTFEYHISSAINMIYIDQSQ